MQKRRQSRRRNSVNQTWSKALIFCRLVLYSDDICRRNSSRVIFAHYSCSVITLPSSSSLPDSTKGKWKLLKTSIGVSAMHMALLPNDRIITFDRTDFGPSNITFPAEKCPSNLDCYAHSVEFYPVKRGVRPLTILSDTWCSSGSLLSNGVLIQSGGNNDSERVVRTFSPCDDCDWVENRNGLVSPRWYASNQLLPDGRVIVVGGRRQFTYEFIPKSLNSIKLFKRHYYNK